MRVVTEGVERAARDAGVRLLVEPDPEANALPPPACVVDLGTGRTGIRALTAAGPVELGPPDALAAVAAWLLRIALTRLGGQPDLVRVQLVDTARGAGRPEVLPAPFGPVRVRSGVWPEGVAALARVGPDAGVHVERARGAGRPGVVLHVRRGARALDLAVAVGSAVAPVVDVACSLAENAGALASALLPALHDAGLEVAILEAAEARA